MPCTPTISPRALLVITLMNPSRWLAPSALPLTLKGNLPNENFESRLAGLHLGLADRRHLRVAVGAAGDGVVVDRNHVLARHGLDGAHPFGHRHVGQQGRAGAVADRPDAEAGGAVLIVDHHPRTLPVDQNAREIGFSRMPTIVCSTLAPSAPSMTRWSHDSVIDMR